jgi:ATP-dependent Clp protease ATP-binding subunit ClpC
MRQAFTDTLKEAIDEADDAARQLNQDFVGTEHLLLGLLAADRGDAAKALRANVDPADLRAALAKELPRGAEPPMVSGRLPLSPKAQRAINNGMVKSQAAGESAVSTRFALLALLEEPGPAIQRALADSGADLDALHHALAEKPGEVEK